MTTKIWFWDALVKYICPDMSIVEYVGVWQT